MELYQSTFIRASPTTLCYRYITMTVTSSLLRHLVVLFRYNAFSGNLSVSCRQHEATTHTGGIGRVAVTTRTSAHWWHDRGVWHCCKNRIQLDQCHEQLCIVLIVYATTKMTYICQLRKAAGRPAFTVDGEHRGAEVLLPRPPTTKEQRLRRRYPQKEGSM